MNKQEILENPAKYTAQQLANFIIDGLVTFKELQEETNGLFDVRKRKEVEHILQVADDEEWEKALQENTEEAFRKYLDKFPNGKHAEDAKKSIRKAQTEEEHKKDEEDYRNVDKNSTKELQDYINKHPNGAHVKEAMQLINDLNKGIITPRNPSTLISDIKAIETAKADYPNRASQETAIIQIITEYLDNGYVSKEEFIQLVSDDHNLLGSSIVKQLVDNGVITSQDLLDAGIDPKFIQKMMKQVPTIQLDWVEPPTKINKQSTEVYFWGITYSGKTCALAALLSVAQSGKVATFDPDNDSQGYGYMTQLANILEPGEVSPLMEGTSEDCFYEMGFDLKAGKRIHPITLIDMPGELMHFMYIYHTNPQSIPTSKLELFDTMHNLLIDNRTRNRKIHIFVIEYGAERKSYRNVPQRTYLDGAFQYLKSTKIFKKDTDAIFILLTKVDKIKGGNRKEQIKQYISDNYSNLKQLLDDICDSNEINGGKVEVIPFSVGDVCFQDYCKFNPEAAENLLRIILRRSASNKKGKIMSWIYKLMR